MKGASSYTLKDLAAALEDIGHKVNPATLHKYINIGNHHTSRFKNFDIILASKIADVFQTTVCDLAGLETPRFDKNAGPLRLTILRTTLGYAQNICEEFIACLKAVLPLEFPLDYQVLTGPWDPLDHSTWTQIADSAVKMGQKGGCDCYVGIGSRACEAFRDSLGDDFGRTAPFLFLAVTYPKESGLISDTCEGKEETNVAGVRYSTGPEDVAKRIHSLFPDKHLCFMASERVPLDVEIAKKLEVTSLARENILQISIQTDYPTLKHMNEKNDIYFGWFQFEMWLRNAEVRGELFGQRQVIATTRTCCEQGFTEVGVSVNEREIALAGRDLLLNYLRDRDAWRGQQLVVTPPLRVWRHR
jgi:hypothetical protein